MKASSSLQREFILRNYETDFMQRIKPSSVLGFFQETAGDHSEEMGLGYKSLAEKGCFWVLSKIYVEVVRRPVYGEKIKVVTWPHEPNKAIYERSFLLEDGAGAAMRAYSRWCILQTSGRILPCSRIEQPEIDFREEKSVVFDDWAIPEVFHSGGAAFFSAHRQFRIRPEPPRQQYQVCRLCVQLFFGEGARGKEVEEFPASLYKTDARERSARDVQGGSRSRRVCDRGREERRRNRRRRARLL